MKKILFVGYSPAIITAIEKIRAVDQTCEITLISPEPYYPYNSSKLDQLLGKKCSLHDVLARSKDFFDTHRVHVVLGQKPVRFSLRKNYVTTEDKEQYPFDILVLTETGDVVLPNIKGITKEGIYASSRLSQTKRLYDLLPITETFIIQSDSLCGLRFAAALLKQEKDVSLVTKKEYLLQDILNEEASAYLVSVLESYGGQTYTRNIVSEILGDSDAKAVRLRTGKVLASQAVIFDAEQPDVRVLKDSPLEADGTVSVNASFQTALDHVFVIGPAAETDKKHLTAHEQAVLATACITGEESSSEKTTALNTFDFDGLNLTLIGQTLPGEGIRLVEHFDQQQKMYRRFYIRGGKLIGAVLMNSPQDIEEITALASREAPESEVTRMWKVTDARSDTEPTPSQGDTDDTEASKSTEIPVGGPAEPSSDTA
ncbi:MAG: FAD-dependent oxidoreductase [Candidatus Omnitrophica bacterium]|nr:FAD-dependent oxidoreductase [Candidatus Omnitrophota bacterium]